MIAANSYSGATTTSRRSLALSSSGTNESSSGVHNNGTLDISNVTTSSPPIKALDGTGNTILGQITLTMTNANSTFGNNYAGVMSGTGGLTIAAGTQTLSGQNTYIGTTDVAQKVSLTLSGRIAGALNNIGTTDVKGGAVGGATDNTGTLTAENGTFQAITNSGTAKPSNSQTGGTTVVSNILQVDGDQSGATGDMDVQSGAQLSGKGVIGGNVTIADNATLSPGEGTNSVSTLKINGNLNLAYNAVQNCNLGKDNAEGEQNKDLVAVKGDLVFRSTINVTGQNRRSEPLGQGIYRIYTYEGSLSGAVPTASYRAAANGAGETIGPNGRLGSLETAPSTTMLLQTSIDHQINLVVSDNVLTFWDGGGTVSLGGMEGNNTVNGGTGTWTTDNANWTDVNGGRDGAWTQSTFALFAAQAGTVTVRNTTHDGTASNVLTHGMQFANNDGSVYKVTGADLYATTATTTIRMGDGTQQGASVTTVLGTVIDNSRVNNGTKLVKSDAGTLILTKDQNYRGETLISGVTTT